MNEYHLHTVPPVWDKNSRVLILGTFPSPRSRMERFFYGHPQNRFWRVLAGILDKTVPRDIPGKRELLLTHHIALWDTLSACRICGASDAAITEETPSDLTPILAGAQIRAVFMTGKKAFYFYEKYHAEKAGLPYFCLPSPSPANCAVTEERLAEAYRAVLPYLSDAEE